MKKERMTAPLSVSKNRHASIETRCAGLSIEFTRAIARGDALEPPRLVGARARFARLIVFLRRQSRLKNFFISYSLQQQ